MSTYTPIASFTATSAVSQVWFSNIPQNYQNLVFIVNAGASSPEDLGMRFNNDTSASYSNNVFAGNGSTISAGSENNATALACTSNAYLRTTVNNIVKIMIGNYTNSLVYKSIQITASLGASGGGAQEIIGGYYRQTTPITSILFYGKNSGHNFLAGSTFTLYGIASGGGYANGGDIVTTDGTYWYHTFLSSGAFIPTKALTADYLVVAGGGGGGDRHGGGGGAGGLRSTVTATGGGGTLETALSLSSCDEFLSFNILCFCCISANNVFIFLSLFSSSIINISSSSGISSGCSSFNISLSSINILPKIFFPKCGGRFPLPQ
jgi:hypothetical protein